MFDYIRYAFKSLTNNKVYTLINVGGLTLGLSVALALAMSIVGMAGLDRFHENQDSVFKLIHADDSTYGRWSDASSALLAPAVYEALPEVTDYCQYLWANDNILGTPENHVRENGFYVDEGWFRMLSFPLIYGDADHILSDPNFIVLSESLAGKLFGDKNPVGETINLYSFELEEPEVFTISGVFEDVPVWSTLQFEFAIPFAWYSGRNSWVQSWGNIGTRSYIRVTPGFILDYNFLDSEFNHRFGELKSMGRIMTIAGFLAIIIACMGLLGLTVHTSERKVKELGIRKINGAGVADLVGLLSGQMARSILIAAAMAYPLAFFINRAILQNFAERIQLSLAHFIWSFVILAGMTALIVGWHIIWAARRNPVEALRYE